MQNYPYFNPFAPTLNQNFIGNTNELDAKMAENLDTVKCTLALKPTLFINTGHTTLWLKDTAGNITAYELKEIKEQTDADKRIAELQNELREIKEVLHANTNVIANVKQQQPTNCEPDKTINEYGCKPSTTNTTSGSNQEPGAIATGYTTGSYYGGTR